MPLPAENPEDPHRAWRRTAIVVAGVLAVVIATACSIGGGGDDDDDEDDDDDDDSMRVVRIVGAGSDGITAGPHGAATAIPTIDHWVVLAN